MYKHPIFQIVTLVILVLAAIILPWNMIEDLDGNQYMVVRTPGGEILTYTTAGWHLQYFGEVEKFPIRGLYEFQDQKVKFNDFGDAMMSGSIQYEIPSDPDSLKQIYKLYHTHTTVLNSLVKKATDKAVFQVGPLLSTRESYAEKRNDLIYWISDQIENGVYKTVTEEVVTKDISGQEKTLSVAKIVMKNGIAERQEKPVMAGLNIRTSNFTIDKLEYSKEVEEQAQKQQKLAMDVQISVAEAKKAEQDKTTTEEKGKAAVAKAKYEKEVIKVQAVVDAQRDKEVALTDAERNKEVAKLARDAAEFEKQKAILEGQGESEKKKLIMVADGALTQKLEAWTEANKAWAQAFANFGGSVVPQIVNGSGSSGGRNAAVDFMEIIGMKAAKDLALDMNVKTRKSTRESE